MMCDPIFDLEDPWVDGSRRGSLGEAVDSGGKHEETNSHEFGEMRLPMEAKFEFDHG
jgi:hypothetical protein